MRNYGEFHGYRFQVIYNPDLQRFEYRRVDIPQVEDDPHSSTTEPPMLPDTSQVDGKSGPSRLDKP